MSNMAVGNTPIVFVDGIFAKLECTNPCGSIKDRIAKYIIEESEHQGLLKPGMRIIEATSGNTGIALSYFGKQKGYDVTIVMPEHVTAERKRIIIDLGAELILTSSKGSFAEAAFVRDRIAEDPCYFNTDQFSNPLNVECHYKTTAQEIIEQLELHRHYLGAFVAGIGTGGTLIGIAKALKEVDSDIHIVAVEPAESAVMSGGNPGHHDILGIGDGFIPAIAGDGKGGLHDLIEEVITISSEDAKAAARYLKHSFNLCVGMSSGANYLAARELQKRFGVVATIFPDGFSRYGSVGLKRCKKGGCPYEQERLNALG